MARDESEQTQYVIDQKTGEVHQRDCSSYDEENAESIGLHKSHAMAVTYVVGLFDSGQKPSQEHTVPCLFCYPLHENLKDSIFDEGSSWRHNAFIEADWGMYAMSYKSAADLLVEQSMEYGVDALAYAVMFLYRHYLEIRIKDVVIALRLPLDNNIVDVLHCGIAGLGGGGLYRDRPGSFRGRKRILWRFSQR